MRLAGAGRMMRTKTRVSRKKYGFFWTSASFEAVECWIRSPSPGESFGKKKGARQGRLVEMV